MKDEKRAELRIILANFVIVAARDPHEPDTMLRMADAIEEWCDNLADERTSRALGAIMHIPTDEEIRHFNDRNQTIRWAVGGGRNDEKEN